MSELLAKRPEIRASLIQEKADLLTKMAKLAMRIELLASMSVEASEDIDLAAERVTAINEYLGE